MENDQIILELQALERYFENGKQRAYSLRKQLESVYSSAPKGEETKRKMADMLNRRAKKFEPKQ